MGMHVAPRYYTSYGPIIVQHDVLANYGDRSIVYECTGQAEMSEHKIAVFAENTINLAKALESSKDDLREPSLKEAVLVSSSEPSSWKSKVRERFNRIRDDLQKRSSIQVSSIEGYELLWKLLDSGVLGLRQIGKWVHFVGPEDEGIRYDTNQKSFVYGTKKMDDYLFRKLPHSFLPSHYWEQRYRNLVEEQIKDKDEGDPSWFTWTYAQQLGIGFVNIDDLKLLYERHVNLQPRSYTIASFEKGCVATSKSRRGNRSYEVYVFDVSESVGTKEAKALKNDGRDIIGQLKSSRDYLEGETFFLELVSASETWSPLAWAEAHFTARGDFYTPSVKKGDDVLGQFLAEGLLGFAFAGTAPNQIKLVGPGIPALRVKEGKLGSQPVP
jgi:hypothetical protein